MLALALQAEVDEYIRRHEGDRDKNDHALVVRNGRSRERVIQLRNPGHADHQFRRMPIADSGPCRSLIPGHVDHNFR